MNKSIFIIGANGVVGSILSEKLQRHDFELHFGHRAKEGESIFNRSFIKSDLIINLAYDLSDKDIEFLENFDGPVLDATSRYRTNPGWIYGLPNISDNDNKVFGAKRVSNPGCFSQAGIILLLPLLAEGILDRYHSFVTLQAIGGYSSAGKPAYALVEKNEYHSHAHSFTKPHPHHEEIKHHSKFKGVLEFNPISAEFERGTFVKMAVPMQLALLSEIEYVYRKYYSGQDIEFKKIPHKIPLDEYNGREGATLYAGEMPEISCVNIAIHFDNLLKGAASTAFKNVCAMLKLEGK